LDSIEKAFNFWISQYPESYHPLDMERFYEFVDAVAKSKEHIGTDWLREKIAYSENRLNDKQTEDFVHDFERLLDFAQWKMGR